MARRQGAAYHFKLPAPRNDGWSGPGSCGRGFRVLCMHPRDIQRLRWSVLWLVLSSLWAGCCCLCTHWLGEGDIPAIQESSCCKWVGFVQEHVVIGGMTVKFILIPTPTILPFLKLLFIRVPRYFEINSGEKNLKFLKINMIFRIKYRYT
jgi:hypothetical protein